MNKYANCGSGLPITGLRLAIIFLAAVPTAVRSIKNEKRLC